MNDVDDQLARQVPVRGAEIILFEKRLQHLAGAFLDRHLWEEILAAQHPSTAHRDQVNAGPARTDGGRHDVHVTGTALHALLVLHATQQCNLIADFGRALEVQRQRRLLHAFR